MFDESSPSQGSAGALRKEVVEEAAPFLVEEDAAPVVEEDVPPVVADDVPKRPGCSWDGSSVVSAADSDPSVNARAASTRPRRATRVPNRFGDFHLYSDDDPENIFCNFATESSPPLTIQSALESLEGAHWRAAARCRVRSSHPHWHVGALSFARREAFCWPQI